MQQQVRVRRQHRSQTLSTPGRSERGARRSAAGSRIAQRYTAFGIVAALSIFLAISNQSVSRVLAFLDYGTGVLALLSLTASTMWGLAATDRLVLGPGHRLIAQAVHRGLAVTGLGFLSLHIWAKVSAGSTSAVSAALPFVTDTPQSFMIGLGTVAGYLFLAVAVTGAVRGVFAPNGRSRWWRALHMSAYVAWGLAVVHGLRTGRPVYTYVVAGYSTALAGVAVVLLMRLAPRRDAPQVGSTRKKEQP